MSAKARDPKAADNATARSPEEEEALRALTLFDADDRPRALALAARTLETAAMAQTKSCATARALCRCLLAKDALSKGLYPKVVTLAEAMDADAAAFELPEIRVKALRILAASERYAGRHSMSFRRVSEAVDEATVLGNQGLIVETTLDAANGLIQLNGPQEALPLLRQIDAMCASDHLAKYRVRVQYYFARASLALRKVDEADRHLVRAREFAQSGARLGVFVLLDVVEAAVAREHGQHKDAAWFEQAQLRADQAEVFHPQGELLYEWALRAYHVDNDLHLARDLFSDVLCLMDAERHLRTRVDTCLLLSEIHEALGDEPASESALQDAIALSTKQREMQLAEMGAIVRSDIDRTRWGRAGAADHARRALVEEMVYQLEATNTELQGRMNEAVHDLRSPLTVLKLVTSSAVGLPENEDVVRAASQQIADIISILDHSAPTPLRTPETFASVLERCLPLYKRHAANKGSRVELVCETRATLPRHESVVRRIVFNLVENALKFSPPNSCIVLRLSEQTGQIVLQVADEGPGFALTCAPAIPTAGEPSTGLGLEIVRRLLAQSGGTLRLSDRPGGGLAEITWPTRR